jgi:hypothetical protein
LGAHRLEPLDGFEWSVEGHGGHRNTLGLRSRTEKITLELAMQRTKGRPGLLVFTWGLTVFALA